MLVWTTWCQEKVYLFCSSIYDVPSGIDCRRLFPLYVAFLLKESYFVQSITFCSYSNFMIVFDSSIFKKYSFPPYRWLKLLTLELLGWCLTLESWLQRPEHIGGWLLRYVCLVEMSADVWACRSSSIILPNRLQICGTLI